MNRVFDLDLLLIILVFVQPGFDGACWLSGGIFLTRGRVVARSIPDNWKGNMYVHMMKITHTKLEIYTNYFI